MKKVHITKKLTMMDFKVKSFVTTNDADMALLMKEATGNSAIVNPTEQCATMYC